MTSRSLQTPTPQIRNIPMRPRVWQALLDTPGSVIVESDGSALALVPEGGALHLYWSFASLEIMRQQFSPMFEDLRAEISAEAADYVVLDLVEVHGKEWLDPILLDADFSFFAEWLQLTNPVLDPEAVPEFPAGVTMRRARKADHARVRELWAEAYGEGSDSPRAIAASVDGASWIGVLESAGKIVGFAANGAVHDAEGRILTAAVAPEARGNGYGTLLVQAAAYQLTTKGARTATIVARPDVPQALRSCSAAGFRPGRSGLEYRRTTDEDAIREERDARRVRGVKARFGNWR